MVEPGPVRTGLYLTQESGSRSKCKYGLSTFSPGVRGSTQAKMAIRAVTWLGVVDPPEKGKCTTVDENWAKLGTHTSHQ